MANAFSPDLGMDIGASNVRPYQPDSLNFSSLGRAFSGLFPEAASTESQSSDDRLAPFSADLYRIDQIEDPNKREIYFRQAYKNALAVMPGDINKVKTIYDEFRGVSLPAGSPISAMDKQVEEFSKTDEGAVAINNAYGKAKRPDGSVDYELYSSLVSASALQSATEKAQLTSLERKVKIGDADAEVFYENEYLPKWLSISDRALKEMTSDENMIAVMGGKADELTVQSMINGLKQGKAQIEADVMQGKARAGITSADGKYSVEPITAQWGALITALETNQKLFTDSAKTLSDNDKAKYLLSQKNIVIRMIMSDERAKTDMLLRTIDSDETLKKEAFQSFRTPPSFERNAYSIPNSDQGFGEPVPLQNLTLERRIAVLPEFSRESVAAISSERDPVQFSKDQIESVSKMTKMLNPDSIKTSEAANGFADSLGYTYLSLINRPQSSYSLPEDIQDVFGSKAFAVMGAIAKTSPSTGASLYKQAHRYAQDETNKHIDSLTANFATVSSMDMNPFEAVIEKGQVVLKLNEEAVRSDPDLRKAMSISTVTGRGQATSSIAYTDPYKVLDNYMGLFNSSSGRGKEIANHIKALNILYNQMGRLPEDIRNSENSGQVYLAERLSMLPSWRKTPSPIPQQQEAE